MPLINIKTAPADITKDQATRLITDTTKLMSDVMGKKQERTTVHIQPEDGDLWAVGGQTMNDQNGRAVLMEINITVGTNSTADKEEMIWASHKMLSDVLNSSPEATYIVINEIPGESWGKAGIVMAERAKKDREDKRHAQSNT